MAVAETRRAGADRAVKHWVPESLSSNTFVVESMVAFDQSSQPPGTINAHFASSPENQENLNASEIAGRDSTIKKRRPSKVQITSEVRRSASTPQIRGLAEKDSGMGSPTAADKRRNKLGYHRTSVACGHCRRRKIRCLLPNPEDMHGRCLNCIRLKKECNFHPVNSEQPMSTDGRGPGSRKDTGSVAPSSSTQSSPRASIPSHQSTEELAGLPYAQGGPQFQAYPETDAYGVPNANGVPLSGVPYGFPPTASNGTSWSSPQGYPGSGAPSETPADASPSPYWTSPQATAAPGYPGQTLAQVPSTSFANGYALQQGGQWVPARSMSFGTAVDSLPEHYAYQSFRPPGAAAPQPGMEYATPPVVGSNGLTSGVEAGHGIGASSAPGGQLPYGYPGWEQFESPTALQPSAMNEDPYWYATQGTSSKPEQAFAAAHYAESRPFYPPGSGAG
ncbi:hypothetical protein EJ06DRAFT_211078 [Trichodelitschia bisporula]|uniref:Zn(2)-C6 fungal-type domain-containing protein n=1 Tax=Trichodelitschia bisporula TaxID=703511 RepID=A0A6G1I972_9PEZI|nr:hypothetical protein EJ06DRAFT_211078 [Trichodelitschia bisporula]